MDNHTAEDICPVCGAGWRRLARFRNGRTVNACVGCGLRRLLPLPSADELERFYGRPEYYTRDLAELHDELVAGYDTDAPIIRLYRRHIEAVRVAVPPPARLLEVGCARGVFLDLARRAGYQVSGVEMNRYAAAYARRNFGLDVSAGSFEEFSDPGGYDVIAAFDVIEHVIDPAVFMARVAALLKPGGLAFIGTPDSASSLYRLAEALSCRSGGRFNHPLFRFFGRGVEHLSVFDRANLAKLAAKNGLRPLGTYGYGIPVGNMADLSAGYRLALSLLGAKPYEFVMSLEK